MRANSRDCGHDNELVLSQEEETQIHHSTYPIAQIAVVRITFSRRSWQATLSEGMTKAISYATLSSSKQLLNDAIFIWFTDKNLFALAMIKNSHSNRLYSFTVATKKKRSRTTSSHKNEV